MNERYISARGLHFFTCEQGKSDGPVVVLLHGLLSTSAWWELVAKRLESEFRVIRLDFRGHGRSEKPATGYTVQDFSEDVRAVLAELYVQPTLLVGHSFGATVALRAGRDTPVLCVDGGTFSPELLFGTTWDEVEPRILRPRRGRLTEKTLRIWTRSSPLVAGSSAEEIFPLVLANFAPDVDGVLRFRVMAENEMQLARSYWHTAWLDLLRSTCAPVGAVPAKTGKPDDEAREKSLCQAEQELGDRLSTYWISGGHDLPIECPNEVSAAIFQFSREARRYDALRGVGI